MKRDKGETMDIEAFGRLPCLPEGIMPAHMALAGLLGLAVTTARRATTDVERASSLSGLAELSALLSLADFSREQVDEVICLARQAYKNSTLKVSGDPRRTFARRPGRVVGPHRCLNMVEDTVRTFVLDLRAEKIMRGRKKPFHLALIDRIGELVTEARAAARKAEMVDVWKSRAQKGRVALARASWGLMYLCLILHTVDFNDSVVEEVMPRLRTFMADTADCPDVQEFLAPALLRYGR